MRRCTAMKWLWIIQILAGLLKLWMGYRDPPNRRWHVLMGLVIIALGIQLAQGWNQ